MKSSRVIIKSFDLVDCSPHGHSLGLTLGWLLYLSLTNVATCWHLCLPGISHCGFNFILSSTHSPVRGCLWGLDPTVIIWLPGLPFEKSPRKLCWLHNFCILHDGKISITWMMPRLATNLTYTWTCLRIRLNSSYSGLWVPCWLNMGNES